MKLNVFSGGRPGDELVAVAEHLHRGRSTHVVEVRVRRGERLVAYLVLTNFVIPPAGDGTG
jgi:acyl-coenzyme A thioesterase PaaI-like protein